MRLLMVAHSDAHWTPYYARHFQARGDKVLLVSFMPRRIEGVPMEFVGVEPFDKFRNKHLFFTRTPHIRRIIKRFRPDLIYAPYLASNGLSAVLAAEGLCPVVVASRGSDVLIPPGSWRSWLFDFRTSFVCKRAALVHTVSSELTAKITSLKIPRERIVQIPLGVNSAKFRPDGGMPRPLVEHIVCTRNHEPVYDISTLLRALALMRSSGYKFKCTFAGFGTLWQQNRALASGLGLDSVVSFTGHLPHEKLPALLQKADIYISASLSDGTSSSLLEGMSSGLLPVVSDIAANRAWIEHGINGLLVSPGDYRGFSEAIECGMNDAQLRQTALTINQKKIEYDGNMLKNMNRLSAAFENTVHDWAHFDTATAM